MQSAQTTTEIPWVLPGVADTPQIALPTDRDSHAPCATWHVSGSLKDGKPITYQQYCERWRDQECPICFKRRLRRIKSEIGRAYLEHGEEDFYVVLLSKAQASAFAKQLSANDSLYRRLPTDLWDYIIFQPFPNCPESDMDWRDLDWETLINTPKGRRPSGKLGVEKKGAKDVGPVYKAEVITIEYDAHSSIVKEAWKKAIEQTADANPHNPEQAEACLNERLNHVAFWIAELGGHVIKVYYRTVSLPENSVLSWSYKDTIESLDDLSYTDSPRFDEHGDIIPPF